MGRIDFSHQMRQEIKTIRKNGRVVCGWRELCGSVPMKGEQHIVRSREGPASGRAPDFPGGRQAQCVLPLQSRSDRDRNEMESAGVVRGPGPKFGDVCDSPFRRRLRCSLVTDRCGYAPHSRLACAKNFLPHTSPYLCPEPPSTNHDSRSL